MIPKSCRLFRPDHAPNNPMHDPKSRRLPDEIMLQKQILERDDQPCSNASRSKPCDGQIQDSVAARAHLPSPGDGQMPPRSCSTRTVVDNPEVRRARLAGVREGAQAAIATGTDRPVFTRAEGLLVATATASAAAWAIVYDTISRTISHAGVGEGLAVAAATSADRTVFHGADLRPRIRRARAWRTRPRSIVDDDSAGGENYRQQHNGKPMPRDDGRWKFHDLSP